MIKPNIPYGLKLPMPTRHFGELAERRLFQEFSLATADRLDLAPAGRNRGRLRMEADRHHLIVSGSRFWFVFNRMNGSLESWRVGEKEIIAAQFARDGCGLTGIQPNYLEINRPFGQDLVTRMAKIRF